MVVLALTALTGCGGNTQSGNADEFRSQVKRVGYNVKLLPAREDWPGLVEGVGTSKDGIEGRFSYSFGPGPRRDVPKAAKVGSVSWFNGADEMYSWTQDYPSGKPTRRKINHFYDMVIDIEDAACRVLVDRKCGV